MMRGRSNDLRSVKTDTPYSLRASAGGGEGATRGGAAGAGGGSFCAGTGPGGLKIECVDALASGRVRGLHFGGDEAAKRLFSGTPPPCPIFEHPPALP